MTMQHSVAQIGQNHENISTLRKDKKLFVAKDFLEFAVDNADKYGVSLEGELYMVSTWHSNDLVEAYQKNIK